MSLLRFLGGRTDRVEHFEIPADNPERAVTFYTTVFGWTLNPVPGVDYTRLLTLRVTPKDLAPRPFEVNGAIVPRSAHVPTPVVTISVADLDDALRRIEAAGGSILVPKTPFGDRGYTGYFKDSEGNVMGLWQVRARA